MFDRLSDRCHRVSFATGLAVKFEGHNDISSGTQSICGLVSKLKLKSA